MRVPAASDPPLRKASPSAKATEDKTGDSAATVMVEKFIGRSASVPFRRFFHTGSNQVVKQEIVWPCLLAPFLLRPFGCFGGQVGLSLDALRAKWDRSASCARFPHYEKTY